MPQAAQVFVKGGTELEDDETFFVNLSNPVNATISDGQGLATILNDAPRPENLCLRNDR